MATRNSKGVVNHGPSLGLIALFSGSLIAGVPLLTEAASAVRPPPARQSSSFNQSSSEQTSPYAGQAPPYAQAPLMSGTAPFGPSYTGCRLGLPSGQDRDAGLSQLYLDSQQGRDWLLVPSLTGREVYSDNVTLAPRGEEQSDFVTEIIPGVTACQSGPRVQSQFHYQLDALYYAKDQNRNNVFNEFEGQTHAEVLPQHLFFDARTNYDQAIINPQRTFSNDKVLDVGNNRTTAWTFSLSPYWLQSLGPLGISTTRYSYERTLYADHNVPDDYSHSISFNLTNPPYTDVWSWDVNYRSEQFVRQGNFRTVYFDTASAQLGYQLTNHWQLLGKGGVEDNYRADGTTDRFGSTFWNAGFRWSDQLTSFEFRYGHRFFGSSYLAKLMHRGPHLTTSLSYTESPEVVSPRNRGFGLSGQGYQNSQNSSQDLIFVPNQQNDLLTSLNDNRVFLSKRVLGVATYDTGRSTIRFNAYWENREFLQNNNAFGGNSERVTGFNTSWRWQWLPRTALIPRFSWEKAEYGDGQVDYIHEEDISLAHLISPTAQAGLTLRHQQRNSTSDNASYRENAVIVELIKIF